MSDRELWKAIHEEAEAEVAREPALGSLLRAAVLDHDSFAGALCFQLSVKLASPTLSQRELRDLCAGVLHEDPAIADAACADVRAIKERDPACRSLLTPLLYLKGFHAVQTHRVAHALWERGRRALALYLQNRSSEAFGVDIHPAARIGRGIMIDHATSVVIGETSVVEDNVSMLHEVTLGGTGKETGDRHPKIRAGVLISAGAKILGNVEVGEGAKVGAGSVVLTDVPAHTTVVGVPARVVGQAEVPEPAREMDHRLPDYEI